MVQYVFTPWRDRHELLLVRDQLYANSDTDGKDIALESTTSRRAMQHQAVARISMWVQRGNCPHMVESTALLMAAVLSDEAAASRTRSAGSETYAVRAAYSAAFSRFVTGLLDSHQDKLRKQSMYSIAKVIGLPATFVELRHQSTHEQLPSLAKLRSATATALVWIQDYYWKHLSENHAESHQSKEDRDPCRALLLAHLRQDDEGRRAEAFQELVGKWDTERLLSTLAELQETLPGNQVYLKCLRLSRELLALEEESKQGKAEEKDPSRKGAGQGENAHTEKVAGSATVDETPSESLNVQSTATGWSRYQGQWEPKPIGVV